MRQFHARFFSDKTVAFQNPANCAEKHLLPQLARAMLTATCRLKNRETEPAKAVMNRTHLINTERCQKSGAALRSVGWLRWACI